MSGKRKRILHEGVKEYSFAAAEGGSGGGDDD